MYLHDGDLQTLNYAVGIFLAAFHFLTGAKSLPDLLFPTTAQSGGRSSHRDRSFLSILYNPTYVLIGVVTFVSVGYLYEPYVVGVIAILVFCMWRPRTPRSKPRLSGFWSIFVVIVPAWLAWPQGGIY